MRKLIIITGASGSGKTTLVELLKEEVSKLHCLHFDSIGVPSLDTMRESHGSIEEWQKAKTFEWIERIKKTAPRDAYVIFEGQMRICYVKEALKAFDLLCADIVLLDCSDEERAERLHLRGQPGLASREMFQWASFLREEARRAMIGVIDTTGMTEREVLAAFLSRTNFQGKEQVPLVPYDTSWPEVFNLEEKRVRRALGSSCIAIHHIGSTAVPDLLAKPFVDILAEVSSFNEIDLSALESEGFVARGEVIPTGRYFRKPGIHLHLFEKDNPNIADNLAFRDWLRLHEGDRRAYAKLKEELAKRHGEHNLMAYSKAKTEFINAILQKNQSQKNQVRSD